MKVRLAIAAAVLALSAVTFTPTHTAAAPPGGTVFCSIGEPIDFPQGRFTLQGAIAECLDRGGHPILIMIGGRVLGPGPGGDEPD